MARLEEDIVDRTSLYPKTLTRPSSKSQAIDNWLYNPSKLTCISQKRWLTDPHCARRSYPPTH
jgi:hypothetical protein